MGYDKASIVSDSVVMNCETSCLVLSSKKRGVEVEVEVAGALLVDPRGLLLGFLLLFLRGIVGYWMLGYSLFFFSVMMGRCQKI